MPDFAGLIQKHLQGHGENHGTRAPWKLQAEMFLGLLQGMGSQVPSNRTNQTKHYVNEIIKLLEGARDDIFNDAQTTKNTTQVELNELFKNLQDEENAANTALNETEGKDGDLANCYTHLHEITANKSEHCDTEKAPPQACVKKNNTR